MQAKKLKKKLVTFETIADNIIAKKKRLKQENLGILFLKICLKKSKNLNNHRFKRWFSKGDMLINLKHKKIMLSFFY